MLTVSRIRGISLIILIFASAGCGLRNAEYNPVDMRATLAGASQLFPNDEFEKVELAFLLDPRDKRSTDESCISRIKDADLRNDVDAAIYAFDNCYILDSLARKKRRDEIQERILQVSEQYCNVFRTYLQRARSGTNFWLGSLSTLTGVAGGVVTGLDGSRLLSGLSGVFSGVRAEYNQQFFLNLATPVITKGIASKRKEIYDHMVNHGQAYPYEKYNVAAAIKDAIRFHGACSVVTGFETAEKAIELVEDPGMDQALKTIIRANAIRRELNEGSSDLKAFRKIQKTTYLEAGKPFPEDEKDEEKLVLPLSVLAAQKAFINRINSKAIATVLANKDLKEQHTTDIKTAIADQSNVIGAELEQCSDQADSSSINYQKQLEKLNSLVSEPDKIRQQAEVKVAAKEATEVTKTIEITTQLYQTALNRLEVSSLVAGAAGKVPNTIATFKTEVGAIKHCTELKSAKTKKPSEKKNEPAQASKEDSVVIRKLQGLLTEIGFDTKGVDGIRGNNTNAAVQAWMKLLGLEGKAEDVASANVIATLDSIIDGVSRPLNRDSFETVVLERLLSELGEDVTPIDGERDAAFTNAINKKIEDAEIRADAAKSIAVLLAQRPNKDWLVPTSQ